MKLWVKMSTGLHKDRKMWKLSKDAQLVFFYLLSLAGAEDTDGVLPSPDDIALELWFLKLSEKSLNSAISELEKSEIIEEKDGKLHLKNFHKWQISEKTKSEINRDYYLKSKNKQSEFQTEKNLNSDLNTSEIQSEFRKNSDKIQTLEIEKEIEIDIEKDKDKEKEKELIAPAVADGGTATKKNLKPEDDDFWKFAKENGEMGKEFFHETGIFPVKKEFGRWVNDLRDLAEAGITVREMQNAVSYMRSQNLTISAPGSILSTARWLKSNPRQVQAPAKKTYSYTEVAEKLFQTNPEEDVIDL